MKIRTFDACAIHYLFQNIFFFLFSEDVNSMRNFHGQKLSHYTLNDINKNELKTFLNSCKKNQQKIAFLEVEMSNKALRKTCLKLRWIRWGRLP